MVDIFFIAHLLGEFITRLQYIIFHLNKTIKTKSKIILSCVLSPRDKSVTAVTEDKNIKIFETGNLMDAYYILINARRRRKKKKRRISRQYYEVVGTYGHFCYFRFLFFSKIKQKLVYLAFKSRYEFEVY